MEKSIGTIISTIDGPSPGKFAFVIEGDGMPVRKNQFVELKSPEGKLIARVDNIIKTNRYFERAESVREYERSAPMSSIFPTDRWEYVIAEAKPLGVYSEDFLRRTSFPPSPGTKVFLAENATLKRFLGFDDAGLELGEVQHHELKTKLNLSRLLNKHLALLSLSGAGKSYLASIIIEELLDRKKEGGRLAILVIDSHGEYTGFGEPAEKGKKEFSDKVKIVKGNEIRIGTSNLYASNFAEFAPEITAPGKRELDRILGKLKEEKKQYNLDDVLHAIDNDKQISESIQQPLYSNLSALKWMNLFNYADYPPSSDLKPGNALILDLSDTTNLRKKRIIVAYLTEKLFRQRQRGNIPPFLEIIEEAHQFAPSGEGREDAVSKGVIEKVAREGRKFHACLCLISQRPVHLSTTALSQANTHIILRVTNPYDLKHIGESSEGITSETLDTISSLKVGEALIVGEAVNFPVFVKIRDRKSNPPRHAVSLEDAASRYEENFEQEREDAKAFM